MWENSRVEYDNLNSRQTENYNFQKVSGILAEYGFFTIRLTDDWQGADFIAIHVDEGTFLKVQLKGALTLDAKYIGKDICFCRERLWYMYPHDEFLLWAIENTNVRNTKGWRVLEDGTVVSGKYTWPSPNREIMERVSEYAITNRKT